MRTIGRHYQGALGDDYFAYQEKGAEAGARLEKRKFEAHITADDVVVDFGCGLGGLLAQLHAGRKVGVEPNRPARETAIARGLEVVASTQDLGSEMADVVISNHALEHTLSPYHELLELHRVLVPRGRLVLWLPIDDWRAQRHAGPDPNHHLYTWTPLLLANLLDEAEFDVTEIRVVTHAWPPFWVLLERLPEGLFDALARWWSIVRRRRQLMAVALKREGLSVDI